MYSVDTKPEAPFAGNLSPHWKTLSDSQIEETVFNLQQSCATNTSEKFSNGRCILKTCTMVIWGTIAAAYLKAAVDVAVQVRE